MSAPVATRRSSRAVARRHHPTARVRPDGRGPRRPVARRTGPYLVVLLATTALVAVGVVMVLSASAPTSAVDGASAWSVFRRHLVWTTLGAVAFGVTSRVDYHRWRAVSRPLVILSLCALAAVFVPGLGLEANGATRWLGVGGFTFQPSELAKFALVVFGADLLSRPSRPVERAGVSFVPLVLVTGLFAGLLVFQPHLGAIIILAAIVMAIAFYAGTPLVPLAGAGAVAVAACGAMVALAPWRMRRLFAFRDPWADPLDSGFQLLQSLHAVAVGGVTGVGLGQSRAKWGFLPYAHTDFIFAVIAEELGFVGAVLVVACFAVLAVTGIVVGLLASDRFGLLLAVGVTAWIVAQTVLNIGAVLSVLPVAGVTLPLLSYGGSSFVVTLAALGVLANVARQGR